MNQEYHEPIPTEYKGVRFRSKSEAIFARALELRGYEIWEYEPRAWSIDGWCPDFWAVAQVEHNHKIASIVIEYKPSSVTDSYMTTLSKRFEKLGWKQHRSLFVLACGNSFNGEFQTFIQDDDHPGKWFDIESKIQLFRHIEQAARYRFDLQNV